ncbi:MAG: hypothetical protein K8F54_06640 [Altibacter sp.]|uniref:hypothetical protein n=1 Tax=Altibacter sp. TaxID=2024823 RepID=UPI001D9F785D|nr:hypothetical protein [Altibacter sp.]MBZ0327266.1 hypothetical protein [Altibacter sp.]
MKWKKRIGIGLVSVVILLLLFFVWYKDTYSMKIVEELEINSPMEKYRMLIATQGSEFKEALSTAVIEKYKEGSFYIEVIDVTSLPKIDSKDYDVIVLLHTWENWDPPMEVAAFVGQNKYQLDKIVVVTTSGNGSYKMPEVDAITGESILSKMPDVAREVILRIDTILEKKN